MGISKKTKAYDRHVLAKIAEREKEVLFAQKTQIEQEQLLE